MKLLVTRRPGPDTLLPWTYRCVPLLALPYAVLAVPLLASGVFNSRANLWSRHFHYNALPWLVLALATVDGAPKAGPVPGLPSGRAGPGRAGRLAVAVPLLLPFYGFGAHPYAWRRCAHPRHPRARQRCRPRAPSWPTCRATCASEGRQQAVPHLTNRDYVTLPDTQNGTADSSP